MQRRFEMTPKVLRLSRVAQWREERFQRAMETDNLESARRAADLYTAAEARAKIVYERLINVTDDPGIKETLGFLMTREIAHQKSFEKALHSIQPNFPQGKLPGVPEYTSVYYKMSQGDDVTRGPWNEGPGWQFVDSPEPAVDGGDGSATVNVSKGDVKVLQAMASRTASEI